MKTKIYKCDRCDNDNIVPEISSYFYCNNEICKNKWVGDVNIIIPQAVKNLGFDYDSFRFLTPFERIYFECHVFSHCSFSGVLINDVAILFNNQYTFNSVKHSSFYKEKIDKDLMRVLKVKASKRMGDYFDNHISIFTIEDPYIKTLLENLKTNNYIKEKHDDYGYDLNDFYPKNVYKEYEKIKQTKNEYYNFEYFLDIDIMEVLAKNPKWIRYNVETNPLDVIENKILESILVKEDSLEEDVLKNNPKYRKYVISFYAKDLESATKKHAKDLKRWGLI